MTKKVISNKSSSGNGGADLDLSKSECDIMLNAIPDIIMDDKNGFIIERRNQEGTQYHQLIVKKLVDIKTKDISFNLVMLAKVYPMNL